MDAFGEGGGGPEVAIAGGTPDGSEGKIDIATTDEIHREAVK